MEPGHRAAAVAAGVFCSRGGQGCAWAVMRRRVRGYLYRVPQMHGPSGEILDPPPQGTRGKCGQGLSVPLSTVRYELGAKGTSALQCGRNGPASKNWRRFFRMFCSARLAMRIRAGGNWLFSRTAVRTRRNCPPECALRITSTPSARPSLAALENQGSRSTRVHRPTQRSSTDVRRATG